MILIGLNTVKQKLRPIDLKSYVENIQRRLTVMAQEKKLWFSDKACYLSKPGKS